MSIKPGFAESILHTYANCVEICSISAVVLYVLAALSILFLEKWSAAAKLAGVGILALLYGLATPALANLIASTVRNANISSMAADILFLAIVTIGGLIMIAFIIITYFLPAIVAIKRNMRHRKIISFMNVLAGFIPLGWNVLLFLSFWNDKN